jgi:hypothetical protein
VSPFIDSTTRDFLLVLNANAERNKKKQRDLQLNELHASKTTPLLRSFEDSTRDLEQAMVVSQHQLQEELAQQPGPHEVAFLKAKKGREQEKVEQQKQMLEEQSFMRTSSGRAAPESATIFSTASTACTAPLSPAVLFDVC